MINLNYTLPACGAWWLIIKSYLLVADISRHCSGVNLQMFVHIKFVLHMRFPNFEFSKSRWISWVLKIILAVFFLIMLNFICYLKGLMLVIGTFLSDLNDGANNHIFICRKVTICIQIRVCIIYLFNSFNHINNTVLIFNQNTFMLVNILYVWGLNPCHLYLWLFLSDKKLHDWNINKRNWPNSYNAYVNDPNLIAIFLPFLLRSFITRR